MDSAALLAKDLPPYHLYAYKVDYATEHLAGNTLFLSR